MNDEKNTLTGSMGAIYYEVINGYGSPMTFEEICDDVRCNPHASSQKIANEQYYFSADESLSYSVQEIADLINITLEIFDEEN